MWYLEVLITLVLVFGALFGVVALFIGCAATRRGSK